MNTGIIKMDVHGQTKDRAKININSMITRASKKGAYILRVIHGFNKGTELRTMIRSDFCSHPKVKRIDTSRAGETDLVLRDF